MSYKNNDCAIAVNGAQTASSVDNVENIPTVSQITIGSSSGSVTAANMLQLSYYPKKFDNATLKALSKVV